MVAIVSPSGCDFACKICDQWSLPRISARGNLEAIPMLTVRMQTSIEDPPYLLPNPMESQWDGPANRLWIQTDNQQVQEVFGGRSTLDADHLRPICTRIARYMSRLLAKGWRPQNDTADLILWDPREYNAHADHVLNCALDLRSDWMRENREGIQRESESGRT